MINNTYCPGIYTSVKKNTTDTLSNAVFIAAAAQSGNTGETVTLYNEQSCVSVFGSAENENPLSVLVKAALMNGAKKVYAVRCDSSEDYLAAFNIFSSTSDALVLICDSSDTEIIKAVNSTVNTRSSSLHECFAVVGVSSEINEEIRNERTVFVSQDSMLDDITSVYITAAATAGQISFALNRTKRLSLCNMYGIKIQDSITPDTADSLLLCGITPVGLYGQNAITRCISSDNAHGIKDIDKLIVCDRVMRGARQTLTALFEEQNFPTYSSIESRLIIFMEKMVEKGVILCYKKPQITQNPQDDTVCDISLSFTSAHGINQIRLFAEASV